MTKQTSINAVLRTKGELRQKRMGVRKELTQADAMFLADFLGDYSTYLQANAEQNKYLIGMYWTECDPADASTEEIFERMNALKSVNRKMKDQNKKVANIIRKLKTVK